MVSFLELLFTKMQGRLRQNYSKSIFISALMEENLLTGLWL